MRPPKPAAPVNDTEAVYIFRRIVANLSAASALNPNPQPHIHVFSNCHKTPLRPQDSQEFVASTGFVAAALALCHKTALKPQGKPRLCGLDGVLWQGGGMGDRESGGAGSLNPPIGPPPEESWPRQREYLPYEFQLQQQGGRIESGPLLVQRPLGPHQQTRVSVVPQIAVKQCPSALWCAKRRR